MTPREALFLSLGFNAALLVALVAVVFTLNSPDRALQEKLIARTQAELEVTKQRAAELEQAKIAVQRERLAVEKIKVEAAATAARAQLEANRRAIEAQREQEKLAKAEASRPQSSADELFEQAAGLEFEGKGAEAVRTYTRAARSGSGRAAKRLGEIYDKGIPGVPRDYGESLKWYNTARALGEDIKDARRGGDGYSIEPQKSSPRSGAGLYDQAAGLERDGKVTEAVFLYRRAARSGDGKAANRLGEIYDKGIPGVESNYAESLKWCNTARALGETPNCATR